MSDDPSLVKMVLALEAHLAAVTRERDEARAYYGDPKPLRDENARLRAALEEALALMAKVPCQRAKLGHPSEPCAWCLGQQAIAARAGVRP